MRSYGLGSSNRILAAGAGRIADAISLVLWKQPSETRCAGEDETPEGLPPRFRESPSGEQDVQVRMKPQRGFHRDSEKAPPENGYLSSRYTFQNI